LSFVAAGGAFGGDPEADEPCRMTDFLVQAAWCLAASITQLARPQPA
jgi:hypothetical protein